SSVTADAVTEEQERQLGATQMATARIRQLPTILEPDVFRALQLLPGIKSASDYSSGLYIRGGSPDQTLILLDRTTVYNPSHFFGFFSTFNPDAIKDVRVYKGAYPAEYGGRIGSVVDIYNKDGNRSETHGTAPLGLLASRAMVEGPHPRGSWMLAIRRSTLEPVLGVLRKQDLDAIPDRFYFVDANGKVNFDVSPDDRVSVSFYAGRDVLEVPIFDDAGIGLRYGNSTISGNWTHLFSERLFSNFTVTGSRYFSLPAIEIATTTSRRDNTVRDLSVKGDFEYIPSSFLSTKLGFWVGVFSFQLDDEFDGMSTLDLGARTGYGSAFVEQSWRPGYVWTLTGGLRASWFGNGSYIRVEPRLSLERKLTDALFVQAGYGRYSQFLTLITNEAFSGLDVWLTSADGVPPAWGDQWVAGVKIRPSGALRVEGEIYYRTMQDLFQLDPFLPDVAGLEYDQLFHFGEGYATGAELVVERTAGRLTGLVGYTFGVTRRRFPSIDENDFYPPKYDRTHDLKANGTFRLGRQWSFTAVFVYGTGQAYTEPASQYRLSHAPFASVTQDVLVSPFNRARLPAYHRLDAGLARTGRLFGADYELQLQVVNAYARENIWFYVYEFEDDGITRETVPQIPVPLPNLSFTMRF
ncbi:MAG: TonB-dependent receptor plug domain-containing protein, partial [Rhodothermales bacterium]|nr:TonB-dependent receptor plug domain-containing protein [Rhodothermales bacterium]